MTSRRRLDGTDLRLLDLLGRDARATYRDLGLAVGLSANAVAQRMRRLEGAGVIRGYRAVVAPDLQGRAAWAVVLIGTDSRVGPDGVEHALAAIPQVRQVLDLGGAGDYQVLLQCSDQRELHRVVGDLRRTPGIAALRTLPVQREVLSR